MKSHVSIAIALLSLSVGGLCLGADEELEDSLNAPVERQEEVEEKLLNKWESGLDVRMTEMLEDSTWILGAQWYRKYLTGTQLGLNLAALPMPYEQKEDGIKTRTQFYYYGLALEQRLIRYGYFRASLAVSYNYGAVYQRIVPPDDEELFFDADVTVLEPALFIFVYQYRGMDLGFSASQRIVSFVSKKDQEEGDEDKLAGVSAGLSFRHMF